MFKLVSQTNVLPRSLFVADVEKDPYAIVMGGFGAIFKGKYGGQLAALKKLYTVQCVGVHGFLSTTS